VRSRYLSTSPYPSRGHLRLNGRVISLRHVLLLRSSISGRCIVCSLEPVPFPVPSLVRKQMDNISHCVVLLMMVLQEEYG
jgi:hypothetical protein